MTERLWMVSVASGWIWVIGMTATTACVLSMIGRIEMKRSRSGMVMMTDDGPNLHEAITEVEGTDVRGCSIRLSDFRGKETVLLLTSLGCSSCRSLLGSITSTKRSLASPVEFLVVIEAPRDKVAKAVRRHRLRVPVVADEEDRIRRSLGVTRSPYGFLVDSRGIVRLKGVVNNREHLEGLIARRARKSNELTWHDEPLDSPVSRV